MKYLLLTPLVLMIQSCAGYCNNYGYIDFGVAENVTVREYSDGNSSSGMKNVRKFPSSYSIDLKKIRLVTRSILERDYPTVTVEAQNTNKKKLGLMAKGGDNCLRVSQRDGFVELWWRTSQPCNSSYPIEFSITDNDGKILSTFNYNILLVRNGEKCGLDGV